MKRPGIAASASCAGALLAAAWLAGFVWFVALAMRPTHPTSADGIVVLTGGADRIAAGMRLLEDGSGRVLLISGVGHGAELPTLLRAAGIGPLTGPRATLAGRVTLGRTATSTAGNATETAQWAHEMGLRSLLVVTAGYHMQRALHEIGRAAPDLALHPVAVLSPALRGAGRIATVRLLASEYTKFLVSAAGFTPRDAG